MAKSSKVSDMKHLIEVGKEKGFLTYDEVNDALPPGLVSADQIEDVMAMFGELEIEVVDSPTDRPPLPKGTEGDGQEAKADEVEEEEERELDYSIGKTNDPVRMYLRE
ncbi:MAG: RNA polymerase sigma factor RpoD, partial [Myxococcales bacterium]|nr:RNA polymerase sigma factor RpoD [Myxococcales bacterium]